MCKSTDPAVFLGKIMLTKQMYDDFCKVFAIEVVDKFSRFLDTAEHNIVAYVVENYRFVEIKQTATTLNERTYALSETADKRLVQFERVQEFFSLLDCIRKSSRLFRYVEATPETKHVQEMQMLLQKLAETNTDKPLSRETIRQAAKYQRLCLDLFANSFKTAQLVQKFKKVGINLVASYSNGYVLVTQGGKSGKCSVKVAGLPENSTLTVEISQYANGSSLWMLVNLKPVTLFVDANNQKDLQHLANYAKNKSF